jgi:RNA polymerase sigma-70 factor (ECF subfamily)
MVPGDLRDFPVPARLGRNVPTVDDLTDIARQAAHGDGAALTALIRATQGDVWRLCAHLVDPAAADDLTQETYLRAIPALRRFRGDSSVRTWLLTIARRVCAHEIRSRQRARHAAASLTAMTGAEPDTSLRTELTEMLAALDPDRRTAFVLTQVLGCSYAEAATICGCPVGTIRSRVARARADLDAMTGRQANPIAPTAPSSSAEADGTCGNS